MTMPQLTRRQASLFALLAFFTTILAGYFFPNYIIVLCGLLIVIFLSVFVQDKNSTIIAGIISALCVGLHMVINPEAALQSSIIKYIFIYFLILFTTSIVLYMKDLIKEAERDKSHVTSLFQNATEGFVVTNSQGEIILVNPSACRMFNYEADELIGQKVEILLPERYKHGHVHLRDDFYKAPQNRTMGHGRDLHGQKKGGENFPVEVSLSTYTQNEDRFVIAFIVDITQRKESEKSIAEHQKKLERITEEMRRLNTELEGKVEERTAILKEALQRLEESQAELNEALDKERQLSEIKSRFVSMASHEFRTPLSTVLSSASLLARYTQAEEQDKRDRHIEKIKGSVKHLNDLLEDFLSLGKLDEGKVGAHFLEFDLPELLQETIDEMKGLLKNDQQVLFTHEGASEVNSDKKLIKNILINLVTNASKFSDEGRNIYVDSRVNEKEARISVKDEGIGISREDQGHLFSSFFRGKNALNIQGTGLGLHIVKRYLDLLGGSAELKSELGKGTSITFIIPVKQTTDEQNDPGN